MLARTHTFTIDGLDARHATVEADVRGGLPSLAILGLPGAGARDVRERVRTAILNSGYRVPPRRTTVSVTPSGPRGSELDLAVACVILAASGQIAPERLATHALVGELALDGAVRCTPGSLAAAQGARARGLAGLILAGPRAADATLVAGLEVLAADSLRAAVRVLAGGRPDPRPRTRPAPPAPAGGLDLADVRGQRHGVQALVVAAAGGHNLLLCGAPGTGKTLLARRLPGLLPPLAGEEQVEVARIAAVAGSEPGRPGRPFRTPAPTVTLAGLLGGRRGSPLGEAVRAHGGVLFLDDLAGFSRPVLEALREPLETGRIVVESARRRSTRPARFQLLAAARPCACGLAADPGRCSCGAGELERYARRLASPVLERVDLVATLGREDTTTDDEPLTSSARAAAEVAHARERQRARLRDEPFRLNARMDAGMLRRHALLDEPAQQLLQRARAAGLLARAGEDRTVRVARTIADLAARVRVCEQDVGAALAMRPEAALVPRRG